MRHLGQSRSGVIVVSALAHGAIVWYVVRAMADPASASRIAGLVPFVVFGFAITALGAALVELRRSRGEPMRAERRWLIPVAMIMLVVALPGSGALWLAVLRVALVLALLGVFVALHRRTT